MNVSFEGLPMRDKMLGGIIGLCVGDALGVPVEFESRKTLRKEPVHDMRGYGTHNQPPGTWSDDTSMTLCLMDSLVGGLDYSDIMQKFLSWIDNAEYTAHGNVFDVGNATRKALSRFADGVKPLLCGGVSENDNGNGSLMRVLPLVFYLKSLYGDSFTNNNEAFDIIHNISALTHAHKRSQIACGIYLSIVEELFSPNGSILHGIWKARKYYETKKEFAEELKHFRRVFNDDFKNLPEQEIRSSGYVVDTLEAALWCLLNTDNYESCVLKAVNLGEDTDTVAAVAGGLAGMLYGLEAIPEKWLEQIARLDYIKELCETLYFSLCKSSIQRLCAYIPYFEDILPSQACQEIPPRRYENGSMSLPGFEYDDEFLRFVDDFYRSGLTVYDYPIELERRLPDWQNADIINVLETADLELTKTILMKCIRVDRFHDGAWAVAIEDGIFLAILRRFERLVRH